MFAGGVSFNRLKLVCGDLIACAKREAADRTYPPVHPFDSLYYLGSVLEKQIVTEVTNNLPRPSLGNLTIVTVFSSGLHLSLSSARFILSIHSSFHSF